jgi:hypothetical protein
VIWTGSDDGLVHVTRDDGKTWENVTPKELLPHTHISTVDASPHDPATAYVAATRNMLGDDTPYLYKTTDYGKTWTKITTGIAADDYTRTIREDPVRRGLLYAGSERGGVHVSFNDGASWQSLRQNLPVVSVWDLAVKDNDLIAATHGRAYWVLDDLTMLRQLHADSSTRAVRLFAPSTTVRFRSAGREAGEGPWSGAMIRYHLGSAPLGPVELAILDSAGAEVATYSNAEPTAPEDPLVPRRVHHKVLPAKAGSNLFVWDLRYPSIEKLPTALLRRGDPEGPLAPPGRYTVRLTANGETVSQPLEIVKDPRYTTTVDDFKALFTLSTAIQEKAKEVYLAVADIRSMRAQIAAITKSVQPRTENALKLLDAAASIQRKLWTIEDALIQFRVETEPHAPQSLIAWPVRLNDKLTSLLGFIQAADARPTDQDVALFNELSARFAEQRAALVAVTRSEVAAFNTLARREKAPAVTPRYLRATN